MNYDQQITAIIDAMKTDKAIAQPWKNYATSDLLRVQAIIRMGLTTTNMQPPAGTPTTARQCTCTIGVMSPNCPVHGTAMV